MKRKNVNENISNASEEEASIENEQTDENSELEGSEEQSVVGADEFEEIGLNASAAESEDDESDIGLDASATESDDESDSEVNFEDKRIKSKSEKVKDGVLQRYQERQGKQLYIRFPHKVPETLVALEKEVKELAPSVVRVHKPRQKHARFCLIDFDSKDDRDAVLSKIKKLIRKGELEKYAVNVPRTESSDFVDELVDRKIKAIENKKAKQRLKNASKKSLKQNSFTSAIVVFNLPKNSSTLQIRELFPNAVDINMKPGKGKNNKDKNTAAVTFPSTLDARNAVKKKLSLGGNPLVIKFDNKKLMKRTKTKNTSKGGELSEESKPKTKQPEIEPTLEKAEEKITKNTFLGKRKLKQNTTLKNKAKIPAK